ncbi:CrcB family protein [Aliamphritea spongicola]|nr:CrcB family protein [Aliamphritea spongicola]
MLQLVFVALGGALGALARYWVSNHIVSNARYELPYGTLLCNVLGSFLMGVCFVLVLEKPSSARR